MREKYRPRRLLRRPGAPKRLLPRPRPAHLWRRACALVMSAVLVFSLLPVYPAAAEPASRASSAESEGYFDLGERRLEQSQTLTDNGDGTYTWTLSVTAQLSGSDINVNSQVAQTGSFTAAQSGDYLLELWGGSGASGGASSYGAGGAGGEAGYVYGVVHLEAGQTLYYTLGGNGSQTTGTSAGGGANDGGSHGDWGSYTVGGGGGYSAVYLFDAGEYAEGSALTETQRLNNYILIAGGGGGGGAGDGFYLFGSQAGTADGGAGGSLEDSAAIPLTGSGYAVPGTVFAGSNGSSSGTSTGYAGRGGSNVPGEVVSTVLSAVDVETPNDWAGTNNPNTPGGSGGAGNIRGGSGGAGFCGGSGGIMTSLIVPTNVGGGGGGSSFVAANVRYSLTDEERVSRQGTHDSSTGGAVHITYLGAEGDQDREFDFTGTVSQYFDIEEVSSNAGTASIGGDRSFTVSGASLTGGETGSEITVTLTLRPRDGFAGGNGVPLFTGDGIVCATPGDGGEDLSATIPVEETCGAVNVPLDFTVRPESHLVSYIGEGGVTRNVAELYTDDYAGVRDELSAHWEYDFIESIGPYVVRNYPDGTEELTGEVTVYASTQFLVGFTVTPEEREPAAAVGDPVEITEYTGIAVIALLNHELNGNDMEYDKTLTYNGDGTYILSLRVTASSGLSAPSFQAMYRILSQQGGNGNYEYSVQADGWYLIQIWGGDGGDGGGTSVYDGGKGGAGGYVWGYCHLETGNIVTGLVGANGEDGEYGVINTDRRGKYGWYTSARVNSTYQMIAGGGGGGGGGLGAEGQDGYSATEAPTSELLNIPDDYNGKNGEYGNLLDHPGGYGGTAGANYRSDAMYTAVDTTYLSAEGLSRLTAALENGSNPDTQTNAGAVRITPLQLDEGHGQGESAGLADYTLDVDLSQYFVLVGVEGDNCYLDDPVCTDNGSSAHITVTNIDPIATTVTPVGDEESGIDADITAEFTVDLTLTPRAGFLGGNDVPILGYDTQGNVSGMKLSQSTPDGTGTASVTIPRVPSADYANVAIPDLAEAGFGVTPQDYRYYVPGDPAVQHSALYENYTKPPLDWQDDYVDITGPDDVTTEYQPSETTEVPIEVAAEPRDAPRLATVGPTVTGQTLTETATIYVRYTVTYVLGDHLSHNDTADDGQGRFLAEPGEDFTVTLSAAEGYDLPENIAVTVNETGARYTYDHNTGVVSIPGDQVNGNIVITAMAVEEEEEYTITYVYQTSPQDQEGEIAPVETYTEGAALSDTFGKTYVPVEYPGYDFIWTYYGDDGSFDITEMETMPAQDLIFVGTYVPQQYTLTIHYVDEDGQPMAGVETYTAEVYYTQEYRVQSPTVEGYLADPLVVEGTMPAHDVEVTVTYRPTDNQLNIIYIKVAPDGSETIHSTHNETVETGGTYSVDSPEITGYHLRDEDRATISGTMTAQGVTVEVRYSPDQYTVTFDPDGGTCNTESRPVLYDSPYSYDPESKTYRGLPTAYREGYAFLGWYLADGTQVTEDTLVATAGDHTLTARWSQNTYTLTIRYVYSADDETNHGGEAHESYTQELPFGVAYHVPSPDIENYTPDQAVVSGTMPARDLTVTVTYTKNQPIEVYFHLRGGTWTDDSTTFWPETDDTSGATGRYAAYLTGDGRVPKPASGPTFPEGTHAFVGWTTVEPDSDTWNTFVDTDGDGSVNLTEFEQYRYDFDTVHQVDPESPPQIVLYAVWDPDVTTVEVVKVDSGTNAPLAGAGFTLYRYQQTVTANTETGGYEFQREKNQYGQYILEDTPVGTVTTDENGTARFANLAAGWYQLTETEAPAGYAPLSGAVVLFLPYGDGTPTIVTDESPPQVTGTVTEDGGLTVTVPNTVQYSAAITAPDSLTLTYTPPDLIWNPETLEYEGLDGGEGTWTCEAVWPDGTGEGTAITVTNTSPAGTGPLTVTVTLDYENDYISLLDLSTLTQTGEGSFQQTEDPEAGEKTLTGTLEPGQAAAFALAMEGTARGLLPETAAPVGVITVRVTRQRRADAAGRGGPALPPLHPRRRGRRSKQG